MNATAISTLRHETEAGYWENVTRPPAASLRAHIVSYEGYIERAATPTVQRQVPGTTVTVILGFGDPLRSSSRHHAAVERQSFVAGLADAHVITEGTGVSSGMQLNLTPIGAYLLFGRPMSEIANRIIAVEDAFGADGPQFVEALHGARDWERRFDLLDAALAARFAHARPASPGVACAYRTIMERDGNVSITDMAGRLGWSRKHLVSQFRDQIGLPPKTFARIARFRHAVDVARSSPHVRWTELALTSGYYDQAHFIRDFSEFAGVTPTRFLAMQEPWGAVRAG